MKTKKRVTAAVLAANRANSLSSPGPSTDPGKSNSRQNSVRHGILSRTIILETEEERAEFEELVRTCNAEFSPDGLLEEILVEEILTTVWKLRIAGGFESRELSSRPDLRGRIRGVFHGDIEFPIEAESLPLDRGWDCDRLAVRLISGQDSWASGALSGPEIAQGMRVPDARRSQNSRSESGAHIEVEAVIGNSLTNITRYQSRLKRDFYKAVDFLRAVQSEKRDGGHS